MGRFGCSLLLLAGVACGPTSSTGKDGGGTPDAAVWQGDGAVTVPDGAPGDALVAPLPDAQYVGPDASTGPQPGDNVNWLAYPTQNGRTDGSWGTVLTDIVQHCPDSWVDIYWDSDKVTHGHETSHGIHAHLRNNYNNTGGPANGFYVLGNQAAIVAEPGIWKHDVAQYVPQVLRGSRFDLYITGSTSWDDTPLYVWDEWNSYTNGTAVAVDLANASMWTYGWRDACMGTVEFVAYAIAVGMAVRDLDATYFATYDQFREFLAWNLRRSLDLFRACRVISDFAWTDQDVYYQNLQTHTAADPLRQFLVQTYGQAFTSQILGI